MLVVSQCFAPNVGGVETHLTDLTKQIRDRNLPTTILTYQPLVTKARAPLREIDGSVTIYRLPWIGFGLFNKLEPYPALQFLYLFPVLFIAAFFYMLFKSPCISAIHAHGMVCAAIVHYLKKVFGTRTVISIHAVYGWLYKLDDKSILPRFLKKILSSADKVLCLAERSREEIIALGVPPENTGTFTYWIDLNVFRKMDTAECRKKVGIPADKFTVLFVGRLIDVKGVSLLIDAAKEMPDINFVFAGDGPLAAKLAGIKTKTGNIIYNGKVNNTDLPSFYSAADVLCVPSQYEEGFGRIIIEALACGCPVIATNRGGIPEAMDSTVGILIEQGYAPLREAIAELKTNRARLSAMKANTRKFAEQRYSSRNVEKIVEAYRLTN